jgi:hypothetical protein
MVYQHIGSPFQIKRLLFQTLASPAAGQLVAMRNPVTKTIKIALCALNRLNQFFFRILPLLASGVHIHFHDIGETFFSKTIS